MTASPEPKLPDVPSVLYDEDRLAELERSGLLGEETVENFDRLTRQAAKAVGAPAAFVSMLNEDGQFLRGCVGLPEPLASTRKTPLEHSICKYTLDRTEPLAIGDVEEDPDLGGHPAVEEYGIEAYLGVPLRTSEGHVVGTFCVIDWEPRAWTEEDVATAEDFAACARTEIELRLELDRRRELETQLRARTDAFETLLDNITDVVTVLDAEGTIRFASPAVEEELGYAPRELKGTPIWKYVHPEDRPVLQEKMKASLEGPDRRPTAEFRFLHADGAWRTLESRGRKLPAEMGMGTFIGVFRDVTERRELEEQVRLLATAVETAETAVIITGSNLSEPGPKIQYVNPAMTEMTGYSEEELLGNTPRMLQGPNTSRKVLDYLKHRLSQGKPVTEETVNYRKDGTPYHVRWRIAPIENDEGETTHFVSVQEDITSEKKREEELERRVEERTEELRTARDEAQRASRLKSALLANMSHEIRTPLTSIIGFAAAIGEEAGEAERGPTTRFARLIEKSGNRLLDTLDGVLNLSKLESGETELALGPVDLGAETKTTADELRGLAEEVGVDLQIEVPDPSPRARGDAKALQIALRNLVQNAIKYTEEGGEVHVRVYEEDDTAVFEVRDTGIGIGEEALPHVFEAFAQESNGRAREYEGSGLGLAVTREAVGQMDGTIDVETKKDEGSRFTVRLPAANGEL